MRARNRLSKGSDEGLQIARDDRDDRGDRDDLSATEGRGTTDWDGLGPRWTCLKETTAQTARGFNDGLGRQHTHQEFAGRSTPGSSTPQLLSPEPVTRTLVCVVLVAEPSHRATPPIMKPVSESLLRALFCNHLRPPQPVLVHVWFSASCCLAASASSSWQPRFSFHSAMMMTVSLLFDMSRYALQDRRGLAIFPSRRPSLAALGGQLAVARVSFEQSQL